jgi:hypothetical protein
MAVVSLFGDLIVSAILCPTLAMEAGPHAAAQAQEQVAPSGPIEAVHLEAANFLEAKWRCAGLEV